MSDDARTLIQIRKTGGVVWQVSRHKRWGQATAEAEVLGRWGIAVEYRELGSDGTVLREWP